MKEINDETPISPIATRRNFIALGLAGSLTMLAGSAKAETPAETDTCFDKRFLPGPADSLVDVLAFLSDIEASILGPYYKVIGASSSAVATSYSDLRKAMREFKLLAPHFASTGAMVQFQHLVAIGVAAVPEPGSTFDVVTSRSELVKATSNALKDIACECESADGSEKLSAEAAKKLRHILKLITDLEPAVQSMEKASQDLSKVSFQLRERTVKISRSVRDAITDLVNADLLEMPDPPKGGVKNQNARQGSAAELRLKAIRGMKAAAAIIVELEGFSVPTGMTKYDPNTAVKDQYMSLNDLKNIIEGTATWVEKGDLLADNRRGGEVRFLNASFAPAPAMYGPNLWYEIQRILGEMIPLATRWRIAQLYARKMAASWYSQADQFRIFYNTIPRLSAPSQVNLYSDDALRVAAATKLSQL